MKNSKYFPFERNRYFYGKLLTVDDFLLEQRYGSNKRRMANRFLYGAGVVAGLDVVPVDEKTISLEAGIALDALGREIVVDVPVIKKLELIDGFSDLVACEACRPAQAGYGSPKDFHTIEEGKKDYVYLCIDYDEEAKGAVHNIAGNPEGSGDYGRIRETYHLSLTELEPENTILDKSSLYEQCRVICLMDGVSIKQYLPRYAVKGQKASLRIEVENTSRKYLSFSYELWLDCLSYEKKSTFTVNFDEAQYEKTGKYSIVYELDCINSSGISGSITRQEDSVRIFLDKTEAAFESGQEIDEIFISDEDIRSLIIKEYYQNAMEDIVKRRQQDRIYLARLYMLNTGESYMIDKVVNVPFNQYVLNQNLSLALHQLSIDYKSPEFGEDVVKVNGRKKGEKNKADKKIRTASGVYRLNLNGRGERGDRYISEEIVHGLGLGNVSIQLGMELFGPAVLWGSGEVFEDTSPMMELAAKVYPENGTFQIGGRLLEKAFLEEINIYWLAVMNEEEKPMEKAVKKIFLEPETLELNVRESQYIEASFSNMPDKSIEWHVEMGGGEVDEKGMYTAPGTPGIYEITAKSTAYPEVKASVFAVVKEGGKK